MRPNARHVHFVTREATNGGMTSSALGKFPKMLHLHARVLLMHCKRRRGTTGCTAFHTSVTTQKDARRNPRTTGLQGHKASMRIQSQVHVSIHHATLAHGWCLPQA